MSSNNSGIYVITNNVSGRQYVGQSYDLERRWKVHHRELSSGTHYNTHLQAAWMKYGEDAFSFEVIEYCPICDLNAREMFWIEKLNSYTSGYNQTVGGDGFRGHKMSDEARAKISRRMRESPSRYWQGKHLSEEHREKLRTAALNRSEETRRKIGEATKRTMANPEIKQRMIQHQRNQAVYCVELDKTFYSMGEAARQTGVSSGNISKVCHGLIKTTGGYHWEFAMPVEAHPDSEGGEINE